ncbi:Sodium:neurotransmitter symporter family protein [Brugia malayi]|uniref:Transporter n=1 Tax=Brugia malayi TaxID=6279 RepID=A0A4E9F5K9_BRUMA|nr:Sodium:neurotransmitter symporter family protein [Brugia malayi]VIO92045.1 Sodium:neurotransmitter symporter family protein [Brugia malayi]
MSITSQSDVRWSGSNNRSSNRRNSQNRPVSEGIETTYKRSYRDANSIYPPFCRKLELNIPDYIPEGDIEFPFEDIDDIGDENKIRGNWSSRMDYLLSAVGFIFNLGNLWRFPYYCRISGGGSFCFCYIVLMLIAGVPLLLMELALGQFPSVGCLSVWKVVPLFKGIGIAMFMVSCIVCVYYSAVAAWTISYFINSFKFALPWATCSNDWNSMKCSVWNRDSVASCFLQNGTLLRNGSCVIDKEYLSGNSSILEISSFDIDEHVLPSAEYLHNEVLLMSDRFDKVSPINWHLALYLLIAWFIVFLSAFKGVKSSGKAVYVIVIASYMVLFVLFVRFLTLPGSITGLIYFYTPTWKFLADLTVWGTAAGQVFYSLLCCTGGLVTLASYSRFHNNILKDAWILCIVDIITSLFCGALASSAVGFLCYELELPIERFSFKGGAQLIFVYLPEAIAKLPVAPIYSILYFAMIMAVILTTMNITMETIVSAICDEFPERLRRNHRHVLAFSCVIFYALGIPLCAAAGFYWLLLLDYFTTTWTLVLLAFLECMAISWAYGVDNFLDNVKWMIGFYPPPYIVWKILWKFVCPFIYLALLSLAWFAYKPIEYEKYKYPMYAEHIGWGISLAPLIAIPVTAVVKFCSTKGTVIQRWLDLFCPENEWGPALAIHRAEYYPLQIPEARRLILPPQKEPTNGYDGFTCSSEIVEKHKEINSISERHIGKMSFLPTFERETAI